MFPILSHKFQFLRDVLKRNFRRNKQSPMPESWQATVFEPLDTLHGGLQIAENLVDMHREGARDSLQPLHERCVIILDNGIHKRTRSLQVLPGILFPLALLLKPLCAER